MPTRNELIPNRPLNGIELKQLILNDVASILNRDGMFREHMGYGRISYDVTIKLHLDNPSYPEHVIQVASQPPSKQEVQAGNLNRNNTPFPLDPPPTGEEFVDGFKRERTIDSPNQARLEHDMPVTVMHKDTKTGHMVESKVHITSDGVEPTKVKDDNITASVEEQVGAAARRGKGKQVTVVE